MQKLSLVLSILQLIFSLTVVILLLKNWVDRRKEDAVMETDEEDAVDEAEA